MTNPTLRALLACCRLDRTWVRGEGVWLTDGDGRRFLDAYAQYGALALGHAAPAVTAAVRAALDAQQPAMVQPYRAVEAEALAAELARAAPGTLERCVFTTSGAEAVEAALKLVRARSGRATVLSASGAFHGKTLGALALTAQPHHQAGFGPLPGGVEHVPFGDADALAARLARGDVAALFLEPIQGERGVHLPPPGYLARARALCTEHNTALVIDEIQTGLGRTGRLFACQHDGVAPDVLLVAKALGGGLFPLGACLVSAAWWDEHFALSHSSTFANNNVACRVGRAVLAELERAQLVDAAAQHGARLLARLERLAARYPRTVAAARGRGLLCALELRRAPENGGLRGYLEHQGLWAYAVAAMLAERAAVLVLPTLGETPVLRIAPPLVIHADEIDLIGDALESVVALLERDGAAPLARALGAFDPPAASAPARVTLPLPPPRPPARHQYAFLVHYTTPADIAVTDPELAAASDEERRHFCAFAAALPAGVVLRAPELRSPTGAVASGHILALPLLPEEMARRGRRRVAADICRAVDLAARLGATVVGLGGYTAPYAAHGRACAGRGPAITTGNTLTAAMAVAGARDLAATRGRGLADYRIAVVGARGGVGALVARLCARERPRRLVLVGSPRSGRAALAELAATLGPIAVEVGELGALAGCDLVFSAAAAGRPILGGAPLAPGTLVCDIARPADAPAALRARRDLTVFDGGLVALPAPLRFGAGNLQGLPDGVQLGCLAETLLMALAGTTRDRGPDGADSAIWLDDADDLMALAARHGLRPALVPPQREVQSCS